jgi:hypothetical protein
MSSFHTSLKKYEGNAVYNISHGIMVSMLEQLEKEANQIFNTVPFDLRMGQVKNTLILASFSRSRTSLACLNEKFNFF